VRVLLISNPSAGENDSDRRDLTKLLESEGHDVLAKSIDDDGWAEALGGDAELVVAAGGDGTVAKVFKRLAGTGKAATILPIGSANNIATSLGFEGDDPGPLVRGWQRASHRAFDIGSLSTGGDDFAFVEAAGGGLFAELLVRANEVDTKPGGEAKVKLGLRLLQELVGELAALEWTVEVDGVGLSGEFVAVEAMNTSFLGPNVPLAPAAEGGDGMLDLTLVRDEHRSALAAHVRARLEERRPPPLELDVKRGRRISMKTNGPASWHYDDDLVDKTAETSSFTASPSSALDVLVPSG
jgi:diacylglycerol kinase family enzyme